jgi:hypothetical protein
MSKEKLRELDEKINKEQKFEAYTLSGYKWSKALAFNKKLIHVDLSFNSFKTPDIQLMGKFLKLFINF